MNEKIRNTRRSKMATMVLLILGPTLLAAGLLAQQMSLSTLRSIRILERLPLTPVEALIPGPARTSGKAAALEHKGAPRTIRATWTDTPSLWVRAVEEKETKDSDGNTSWTTVSDITSFVNFDLEDGSDRIMVVPSRRIDAYIDRSWIRTRGKRRYSEYRIEPGDAIKVVGLVSQVQGSPALTFDREGEYLPILSDESISEVRSGKGLFASLLVCLSLLSISGGCVALMLFFRFQNALAFVIIVGAVESGFLLIGSTLMLASDMKASHRSVTTSVESATEIVEAGFKKIGVSWSGDWADTVAFAKAEESEPPGPKLVLIRDSLAGYCARTAAIRKRFPQWVVAEALGLGPTPSIVSTDATRRQLQTIQPARPFWLWPSLGITLGGLLGMVGIRWGMKGIKVKRLIENIPRTPCAEVEIGITEVVGTIACEDENPSPLTGPLTEEACVWFDYHVQEWRGSGKNRHLHTIERRVQSTIFLCVDESGSIPVDAKNAEVINGRKAKKSKGNRVYTEFSFREGDPLYVLGSGEIDPTTGDSLRIEKDPQNLPFIISNLPESRLKTMKVSVAFWMIAMGIAAITTTILFLLSFTGSVSALHQLIAAASSFITVILLIFILLYNDLVFLRQRTFWAKSNIDVALKKRFDLLPQLENVTKGYARHEGETQTLLTELRRSFEDESRGGSDTDDSSSRRAVEKMLAVRESSPDLKANTVFQELMSGIVGLENEISARRRGYNAAAERYKSRRSSVPEVFLARIFRFQDTPLLQWNSEMMKFSSLELAPPGEKDTKADVQPPGKEQPPSSPRAEES